MEYSSDIMWLGDKSIFFEDSPAMVKVDNVSMVFNMASEKYSNLKEYAIAIAKRQLMFKEFRALDHVSFEVKKGDVFGIMGTNGSGKSTMLKIIAGVLTPSSGTCEISGNIAPLIELGAGFDMELTARENVYLNGALLGYSKKFVDEHFDEIVEFAEVEDFLDIPMKNYSSGMVSRIAFAIATVIVPEILVCDEVLSVGDFMFQQKCEDKINSLISQYGVTVLIVSHSNSQIARLCNKAIWIEKGKTRAMGDAKQVAQLYGSLGGRTGSPEAEKRVSEALCRQMNLSLNEPPSFLTAGSPVDFSLKCFRDQLEQPLSVVDNVVVAPNVTHVNILIGNSIGAVTGSYLLQTTETMNLTVDLFLSQFKPKKIYYVDCGGSAQAVLAHLKTFDWDPEIIDFTEPGGDVFLLCKNVFEAFRSQWSSEALVASFVNASYYSCMLPYVSRHKVPVFILWEEQDIEKNAKLLNEIVNQHFERILVTPEIPEEVILELDRAFEIKKSDSQGEDLFQIANWIASSIAEKFTLYIGSVYDGQRLYILGSQASYLKEDNVLILKDNSSFDSIANCLRFIEEYKDRISRIVFIGNDGIEADYDSRLLNNELIRLTTENSAQN